MTTADLIPMCAASGIAVFPLAYPVNGRCSCGWADCHSPGKHPLFPQVHPKGSRERDTCRGECGRIGHGLYDATTDIGQIAEWLADHPRANWGGRPPVGCIVLDVDPRNDGDKTLAGLEREHGDLPDTLTAITGGQGLHYWFSYNGPTRGKVGEGLDIKSNTGYVVLPPSTHISGGTYDWLNQHQAAYAPAWLKALLNPPVREYVPGARGGRLDPLLKFVSESTEGQRNGRLYWAARRAYEGGLDATALIPAAVAGGTPQHEAAATIRSAERAHTLTAPRSSSATFSGKAAR